MSRITFRMTAGTNVGCVRTNNEDNFIINHDLSQSDWFLPQDTSQLITLGRDGCVLVVADGMGGLNAGEVASAIAIDTVKQTFLDADLQKVAKTPKSIEKFMCDVVVKSDQAIKKHVMANPETKGMGTTLILIWVYGNVAHLVWCGDSRAYIYNDKTRLTRFSKDHSYVQQLVDEGKLDEDLAFDHPESNIITRCLGDFQDRAKPDYKNYKLCTGDVLLICSDGLCGLCRDEEILHIMQQTSTDIERCKQTLIQAALDAGGYDNVTLALFEAVAIEDAQTKQTTSKKMQKPVKVKDTRETKEINEEFFLEDLTIVEENNVLSDEGESSVENTTEEVFVDDVIVDDAEEGEEEKDIDKKKDDADAISMTKKSKKGGCLLRILLSLLVIIAVVGTFCYVYSDKIPQLEKLVNVFVELIK